MAGNARSRRGGGRRKHTGEHENHERWLVSYADFITLLFAFFVVMYSISSVNEGKYRVLSDSIVSAFHDPLRRVDPIQLGRMSRIQPSNQIETGNDWSIIPIIRQSFPKPHPAEQKPPAPPVEQPKDETHKLAEQIKQSLADLIKADLVKVRDGRNGIEVEIKASILFASGSAALSDSAIPVLERIADKLKVDDSMINVQGFTDNVPISNYEFASNWELSAARAVSVVRLFARDGIAPERLAAVGFGEYRPIASNDTADGRNQNRRVVLMIHTGANRKEESEASPADPGELVDH